VSELTNMLYIRLGTAWRTLRNEERGQGMVEYALILVLVAVAAAAAFTGLKDKIDGALTTIGNQL
jgi:Flp pilus assembly pilin Flp